MYQKNKSLTILRFIGILSIVVIAPLAQLVEHPTLNRQVPGSIPGWRTKTVIIFVEQMFQTFETFAPFGFPAFQSIRLFFSRTFPCDYQQKNSHNGCFLLIVIYMNERKTAIPLG